MIKSVLTDDDSDEREPQTQPITLLELVRIESGIVAANINLDEMTPISVAELTDDAITVNEMTVEELMSEFTERSIINHVKHASLIEVSIFKSTVIYVIMEKYDM